MVQSTSLDVLARVVSMYYRVHGRLVSFDRVMDMYNTYISSPERNPSEVAEGFSLNNALNALALCPSTTGEGHHHQDSSHLIDLDASVTLLKRFEATEANTAQLLDEAIQAGYRALPLAEDDGSHLACLNVLIPAFWSRYMLYGSTPHVLRTLTELCRSAHGLTALSPAQKCLMKENLALVLLNAYDEANPVNPDPSPLIECAELYQEALYFHETNAHEDDVHYADVLFSLVITRFQVADVEDEDVDDKDLLERMHHACNLGLAHGPFLDSFAVLLEMRYDELSQPDDLDSAIAYRRRLCDTHHAGHPDHPRALSSLANSLWRRFQLQGSDEDLEECLEIRRERLRITDPYDGPSATEAIASLVNTKLHILEHAHPELLASALDGMRHGHFEDAGRLDEDPAVVSVILADMGKNNFHGEPTLAYRCFEYAASTSGHNLESRYRAAAQQGEAALVLGNLPMAVNALGKSLELLDQWLATQATIELRQFTLSLLSVHQPAYRAFSVALEARQLETAVEFLELGRGLLWSRMRAYRELPGGLSSAHPELARSLQDVQTRLEKLTVGSSTSSALATAPPLGPGHLSNRVMDVYKKSLVEEHRHLTMQYEALTSTIQALPGFERAFRPRTFEWYREAAAEGPVIILNVSKEVSDFVIVDRSRPPIAFALSSELPRLIPKFVDALNVPHRGSRPMAIRASSTDIRVLLRALWKCICQPVSAVLERLGFHRGSRIWLCPCGMLSTLPLHAAGPHSTGESHEEVFGDMFTISYTYTLSALIECRRKRPGPSQAAGLEMLAIGQSSELPMVEEELYLINEIFGGHAVILDNEAANSSLIFEHLQKAKIVHFSTHGDLNPIRPFESHFVLHDGERLNLLQIMQSRPERPELAFLAACHAATGTHRSPDEALSLASALLFCGFRSAVGTLWTMADEDGPTLARLFYERLALHRDADGGVDCSRSAEALNEAIKEMRGRGVPAERWCTFIHVGA